MSFFTDDSLPRAINEDEQEDDGWWRPLLLTAAIGCVVAVHWWILR